MIRKIIFVLLAASAPATASYAQDVDCPAFQHNPDGTWSPTRQIIIASTDESPEVSIGPATSIGPGTSFNGIDIYALLDRRCH